MKNILIIFLSLLLVSAQGQEQAATEGPVSKSGVPILPAAGDIAIGLDATPFLHYLGNMFNNAGTNDLNNAMLTNPVIYFRYHLTETSAVRVSLLVKNKVTYTSQYVQDDAAVFANPLSQAKVEDKFTNSTKGYGINLAYQMSRGYGRLRGVYGVQVGYGFSRNTENYAYGNNITIMNASPTTSAFDPEASPLIRRLETDGGIEQTIGAGLIGGVEYYFLPKVCIGVEVGLGYDFTWGSQSNKKTEQLVGTNVVKMDILDAPGDVEHDLSTMSPVNFNGGLFLMFHF